MNSLSRPPSTDGWVSYSDLSTIQEEEDIEDGLNIQLKVVYFFRGNRQLSGNDGQ